MVRDNIVAGIKKDEIRGKLLRGGRKGHPPDPALNLTAQPASLSPRTGDPGYLAGIIVDNAIKGLTTDPDQQKHTTA